jgi:hypothetical protein
MENVPQPFLGQVLDAQRSPLLARQRGLGIRSGQARIRRTLADESPRIGSYWEPPETDPSVAIFATSHCASWDAA